MLTSRMKCGVKNVRCRKASQDFLADDMEMKLPSCKIVFSPRQLLKLNSKFSNIVEGSMQTGKLKEKQKACLGVVVERLIQRLICNVGTLDSRFSSKFLINLEHSNNFNHEPRKILKFKYLVRIDLISTPALYPEFFEPPIRIIEGTDHKSVPKGYAKIRVHGEFLEQWAGFISPSGFLRRDKIQEKFLELLARAAARPSEPSSPAQVDESKHCGSPGKIVDPITLFHILKSPASHQVFFGSADFNESRFPDPRDFRIAIVEGQPETLLHISFLSPTAQSITSEGVEISITLGVGVAGWPIGIDYPFRLPLDHVDAILGYRAAQLNYYLVPKGPHSSVYCEDRSSVWEIRVLPTEMFLEHHYSPTSVVARVYKILICLLDILKARGVKTINKYILKNLMFFELEQKKLTQQWKPKMVSRRVISILHHLLISLQNQVVSSYFFPEKNILLQDGISDEDYASDRDILEHYLKQLQSEFKSEVNEIEYNSGKDELDNILLKKWDNVIANLLPAKSNKAKRLYVKNSPVVISYTRQQIEYIALLIREILKLKNIQRKGKLSETLNFQQTLKEEPSDKEDFIYLLQIILDQAKQKLLNSSEATARGKKCSSQKMLKLQRLILSYDLSMAMLLDDLRRSKQMNYNFPNDESLVTKMLECLYKAADSDGKVLTPVIQPYLNQITKGSHENCWFLYEWNKKSDLSEFKAIGVFSELVLLNGAEPTEGIIKSAKKGWAWASNCLNIMREIEKENSTRFIIGEKINFTDSGVRLIFTPSPGKTIRFNVSAMNSSGVTTGMETVNTSNEASNQKKLIDNRFSSIKSFQNVLESTISYGGLENEQNFSKIKVNTNQIYKSDKQPFHVQLKEGSPFTLASMETRRQGHHRGLGSIVQALISLQKLTTLQEISAYLPEEERTRVLSDIKKLSKEVQRAGVENYKKTKNFPYSENRFFFQQKPVSVFSTSMNCPKKIKKAFSSGLKSSEPEMSGIYKSMNEFTLLAEKNDATKNIKQSETELEKKEESLRETCRQLRQEFRPTVAVSSTPSTFPKSGFHRIKPPSSSKSDINTPFYIKVSFQGGIKKHCSSTLQKLK